ncbi:MAG: protein kinase [Clostridia bacterium]|nr:protein kinase [Clostridia bacterium]
MGKSYTGPVGRLAITADDYSTVLGYYKLPKKELECRTEKHVFTGGADKEDTVGASLGKRFLKFTRPTFQNAAEMLKIEAKFRMNHPFIEHIYDLHYAVDENDTRWIVLEAEYVSETNLEQFFGQKRTDKEKFCCMLQLAEAVHHYAENRRKNPYVHRDLKPGNIMIESKDGKFVRCVIVDFDTSHVPIQDDPGQTRLLGTRRSDSGYTPIYSDGYTPIEKTLPDQMILWDIYSLGRIFCYILKGEPYFTEDELKEQWKDYSQQWNDDRQEYHGNPISEHGKQSWFGLDRNRFDKKYQGKLLDIIDRMTTTQDKRYKNVSGSPRTDGGVLYDLMCFFQTYFGKEYDAFLSSVFVETDKAAFLREQNTDIWYITTYLGKTALTNVLLQNYNVGEIYNTNGQAILTLYRIDEKIYYVPNDIEKISWEKDTGFELTADCGLTYDGIRLNICIDTYK